MINEHDLKAFITSIVHPIVEQRAPAAKEGIIVGGSYDPTDGTVEVMLGDTYAIPTDEGSGFATEMRVPLATLHVGVRGGPTGSPGREERCILVPTQSGYVALLHDGPDDAPRVPAGEFWQQVRVPATGAPLVTQKLAQNGASSTDAAGGHFVEGGTLHSATTTGGIVRLSNDSTQQVKDVAGEATATIDAAANKITHDVAGNATSTVDGVAQAVTHAAGAGASRIYTIVDGAGNAISHVVASGGFVGLGALASSLPSTAAGITNAHLSQFESNMFSKRLDDLVKFAAAMVAAGVPNAGAVIGQLATLLHIPVPSGSAIVKLAG